MLQLNYQLNAERHKDLQREAENERLARSVEKQEKNGVLRNALNALNVSNKDERSQR